MAASIKKYCKRRQGKLDRGARDRQACQKLKDREKLLRNLELAKWSSLHCEKLYGFKPLQNRRIGGRRLLGSAHKMQTPVTHVPENELVEETLTVNSDAEVGEGFDLPCLAIPLPNLGDIQFDIFSKTVLDIGTYDLEVCAPDWVQDLFDMATSGAFLWHKEHIVMYGKQIMKDWFLGTGGQAGVDDQEDADLSWGPADFTWEDDMLVCTQGEKCKCDNVRSIGVSVSISLGAKVTVVVGGGGAHDVGFTVGCIAGLYVKDDSGKLSASQRWVIIPTWGFSRTFSIGAEASVSLDAGFSFERPFEFYEDFGHGLAIGGEVGISHGIEINYGCCKQPFDKEGAPFMFLWDTWSIPSPFNFDIYYPVPPFISSWQNIGGASMGGTLLGAENEGELEFVEVKSQTGVRASSGAGEISIDFTYARGCRRWDAKILECFNKFNPDGTWF